MTNKEQYKRAYKECIRLLSRREYSQVELIEILLRKDFSNNIIDECITKLKINDYQSDKRYAEMLVRTRVGQYYGKKKIYYNLKQKGIEEHIIEDILYRYKKEWVINASILIKKKINNTNINKLSKNKKDKLIRFMLGKGYDYQIIKTAFNILNE